MSIAQRGGNTDRGRAPGIAKGDISIALGHESTSVGGIGHVVATDGGKTIGLGEDGTTTSAREAVSEATSTDRATGTVAGAGRLVGEMTEAANERKHQSIDTCQHNGIPDTALGFGTQTGFVEQRMSRLDLLCIVPVATGQALRTPSLASLSDELAELQYAYHDLLCFSCSGRRASHHTH